MFIKRHKKVRNILPFMFVVSVVLLWPNRHSAVPTEHQIDLNASQFEFMPSRFIVNQGDELVITLRANDVVHGFYLDGYDIETRVTPGVAQQIELTASHAGKFRYRCSVSCGALHPFMIGELVVRPNNPFWKSILITVIALGGLLLFLWRSSDERII